MSKPSFQATADRRLMEGYAYLLIGLFGDPTGWDCGETPLYWASWCFGHANRNARFAAIGNPDKRGE